MRDGIVVDKPAGPVILPQAGSPSASVILPQAGSRSGIVVVDKPTGLTSQQVVSRIKHRLAGEWGLRPKTLKVGHAGTLDPMATGVLVVGVGKATKLLGTIAGRDKCYEATIRLGQATTTDDAEGDPISPVILPNDTSSCGTQDLIPPACLLDHPSVQMAMSKLTGDIEQVPSAVSAIKVDGRRAYALVRAGETVELKPRPVNVARFDAVAFRANPPFLDVDVVVDCSSGTYVRALARDLGRRLGVGGHLTALRRTRVGAFGIDQAVDLDAVTPDSLTPLSVILPTVTSSCGKQDLIPLVKAGPPPTVPLPDPPITVILPQAGSPQAGPLPDAPITVILPQAGSPPTVPLPDAPITVILPQAGSPPTVPLPDAPTTVILPQAGSPRSCVPQDDKNALALGTFDGVHMGHRAVLAAARAAVGDDGVVIAATFWPHPMSVFAPVSVPRLLQSLDAREEALLEAGADEVLLLHFTPEMAALRPSEFVERLLVPMHPAAVAVGPDFTFGAHAAGTPDTLGELAAGRFKVVVTPVVEVDGQKVSSTAIRTAVTDGDMQVASRLLGRDFSVRGIVIHGDKRGRALGFPTANLAPDDEVVTPPDGVYAGWLRRLDDVSTSSTGDAWATSNSVPMPAAVSVGDNPTFVSSRRVEAYVLDVDIDLYDAPVEIGFSKRLRGMIKFDSVEDLVAQMHRDVADTRRLLVYAVPSEKGQAG